MNQVAQHQCNLHETHHSSEIAFLETKFVSDMFCTSAVLSSGPVMQDLVKAAPLSFSPNCHLYKLNLCIGRSCNLLKLILYQIESISVKVSYVVGYVTAAVLT